MKQTIIEFCTATHNFWIGCLKVSRGCKYCYFYRMYEGRLKKDAKDIHLPATGFDAPLKWPKPQIIFINSWSDFFIKQADEWRDKAWDVIKQSKHHTYIIITKRPDMIKQRLPADWGKGYDNVIIMVSIEDQKAFNQRIPHIFEIPGNRGLILEPLLGPVNIEPALQVKLPEKLVKPFKWIIVGGETGNDVGEYRYRLCRSEWINDIVRAAKDKDVPVFVKQLGTALSSQFEMKGDRTGSNFDHERFPPYLKHRQFPDFMVQKHPTLTKTVNSN